MAENDEANLQIAILGRLESMKKILDHAAGKVDEGTKTEMLAHVERATSLFNHYVKIVRKVGE